MTTEPTEPLRAARTTIEFVRGGQSEWLAPREVEAWQLPVRFAVVQETYRLDMVDAYVDRSLWLRLCEFARTFAEGSDVTIVHLRPEQCQRSPTQDDEKPLETFLITSAAVPDEDWDAPERIVVRRDGAPVLVIATERWIYVGGPALYHDSMTYSIFSKENLGGRVIQFLADAEAAAGWDLANVIIPAPDPRAPDPPAPSLADRVISWIRRHA